MGKVSVVKTGMVGSGHDRAAIIFFRDDLLKSVWWRGCVSACKIDPLGGGIGAQF
jgi:hypothetical protein